MGESMSREDWWRQRSKIFYRNFLSKEKYRLNQFRNKEVVPNKHTKIYSELELENLHLFFLKIRKLCCSSPSNHYSAATTRQPAAGRRIWSDRCHRPQSRWSAPDSLRHLGSPRICARLLSEIGDLWNWG